MTRDRWIVTGVVVGLLVLLVVGNLAYSFANDIDQSPRGWPDVDIGADQVVEYKDTAVRPLYLHLFNAEGTSEPAPVIVLFHGGGLATTRVEQFEPQTGPLTRAGYAVAVAEYRVTADAGGSRAASVSDAIDAVAWLRNNGADHGIDASQVFAGGSSAGGFLAAETGQDDNPPDALVLFNPAVGTGNAPRTAIPTIVFHGDSDGTVNLSLAQAYCDASAECELDVWPGGDHGFFNKDVDEDAFDHTVAETIRFLDQVTSRVASGG